jgi:hypothetical protein
MPGQYLDVVTTASFQTPCQLNFHQTYYQKCYTVPNTDRITGGGKNQIVSIYTVQYRQSPSYSVTKLKYKHLFLFFSFLPMALRPNAGYGLLILEVSRSHMTHHSR